MARNRIKGITIEIDGNTQSLQKSLAEVNGKLRDTQSALKDVDKLLKMDPGNVELLTQKQNYLNEAIAKTREKLEQEKLALEQMKANNSTGQITEEQRALEREIQDTQQSLKNLEGEMKDFGSIGKQQTAAVAQEMAKVGESVQQAGQKVSAVGDKMTAAVSAPIAAAGVGALKASMSYEDALAKLSTIADTSEVSMEDLSNQILQLSKDSGIAADTLANNVYDAISAGQATGDAVNFVAKATQLARAGFTSTDAALDILTTSLNALEIAQITDDFRKDILGEVEDANGCLTEVANAPTVPFALLFQFDGDSKNTRHVLYNCTASKPSIAGETNTESITPKTDTLNLTAAPVHNNAIGGGSDVFKSRALVGDAPYADWFSAVYQGTAAATGITLDQDALALDAGGETAKLIATTVPFGSAVTWTSSDNAVAAVSDGVVIPLSAGSATITAKITVGGTDYTDTCAVTVS